jgi:phosphate transport system protein
MTRTRFHQGLDDLKQKLLAMGGMAEQAVDRAVRAYQTRDLSLCEQVLRDESKINAAERDVDEMSVDLLAMQQPIAIDPAFHRGLHQNQRRPGTCGRPGGQYRRARDGSADAA